MLKHKQSDSTETCSACVKNNSLIKKYEQLIHLYKKKQVRLSTDGTSRIKTTSHTIQMPNLEINCFKLIDIMRQIGRRKLKEGFDKLAGKRNGKLAVLSIAHKLTKLIKKTAFNNIQTAYCQGNSASNQNKMSYQNTETVAASNNIQQNQALNVISELIMEINNQPQLIRKTCYENLRSIRQSASSNSNENINMIKRMNLELEIQNRKLTHQNVILKQCIEELNKRQLKENQKKRQSLEMLAEEISEKNQELISLRQTLKKYELTYETDGNVLEQDVVTMRSDIEHLERIRDKLNNDLDKVKMQMDKVVKSLKETEANNQKLAADCLSMKNKCYQSELSLEKSQKTQSQLNTLIQKLQKKIKRLSLYEKQLEQFLRGDNQKQLPTGMITQQLKSQIILLFMANISDSNYQLQFEHLFDDEEKLFLIKHKEEWMKLVDEQKLLNQIESTSPHNRLDFSGIEGKAGHMDSIFQALDSPRVTGPDNRNAQGPTMRMLQLQLQKNKQVQKISQLKQKFLHIRIIILNLLKSLQIQPNLKTQTLDIIRLVFEVFEFSEEQRDSIFVKKKRLFSFL